MRIRTPTCDGDHEPEFALLRNVSGTFASQEAEQYQSIAEAVRRAMSLCKN